MPALKIVDSKIVREVTEHEEVRLEDLLTFRQQLLTRLAVIDAEIAEFGVLDAEIIAAKPVEK